MQSRVRFNKNRGKVWEALVQSQVRFNRVPEKVPQKVWKTLVQSQIRFNRIPEKVGNQVQKGSEKISEKVWVVLVQSQQGQIQEGSGEGLGGFGAEPGQVQ